MYTNSVTRITMHPLKTVTVQHVSLWNIKNNMQNALAKKSAILYENAYRRLCMKSASKYALRVKLFSLDSFVEVRKLNRFY